MTAQIDLHTFFQTQRLVKIGQQHTTSYQTAAPFPHIVLDDFFPATVLAELALYYFTNGRSGEDRLIQVISLCTPPILVKAVQAVKRHLLRP